MKTITTQTDVFTYSELSESAKEKVRVWHAEGLDSYWYESVVEDAKSIGALMGWEIERIGFRGFWSQGDGAHFEGSMAYAKGCAAKVKEYAPKDVELARIAQAWQDLQSKNFYSLRATVKHRGFYQHENCTEFDMDHLDERGSDDTNEEIKTIARDFMRWIYKQLEEEYEGQTSDENVKETADANEWHFTADGKFFPET